MIHRNYLPCKQEALLASHWCQMAIGILHQLMVFLDLVSSLGWIFGQFHGNGAMEKFLLQANRQHGLAFGPHIMETQHGPSSVCRVAKHIPWLNCHFLGPTIGFQYGQHLFNLVVDAIWATYGGSDLFNHCLGDSHGSQLLAQMNALAEPP